MLMECGDTVCQMCIETKLYKNNDGKEITCFCGERNPMPVQLKFNKQIMKELEKKSNNLSVSCDQHPEQEAKFLCSQCKLIVCEICSLTKHKDHKDNKILINSQNFSDYLTDILPLLDDLSQQIESVKLCLTQQKNNEISISATQFMEMICSVKRMLGGVVKQDKLKTLDLEHHRFRDQEQPQEEEEQKQQEVQIQQQEPIRYDLSQPRVPGFSSKYERTPQKNDDQKYLDFIYRVNKELDKTPKSMLRDEIPNYKKKHFKLLYQASRDGFTAKAFHDRCDYQGAVIYFILSEYGMTFGGFTSQEITQPKFGCTYIPDRNAFIFSLTLGKILRQIKDKKYAVGHSINKICCFGQNDISITDNCNINNYSRCEIGGTYETAPYDRDSEKYLASRKEFKVLEIEVYSFK
eukprot:403363346